MPVVEYDPATGKMKKVQQQVGYEADLTIDAREKKEETSSNTLFLNLNVFIVGIIPIPVPFWYDYDFNFRNQFNSVVATKVIQQYGILKEVQSSQEGAVTIVRNEAFDPVTGQALITSVNNEFSDREYSVNYPAYWGYKSMGPSYQNIGYQETFTSMSLENYAGRIPDASAANYMLGDELLISYTDGNGNAHENNVWVTEMISAADNQIQKAYKCINKAYMDSTGPYVPPYSYFTDIKDTVEMTKGNYTFFNSSFPTHEGSIYKNCGSVTLVLKPRYKYSWPANGTLNNVRVKVVRSGAKNQLNESIQSYTGMSEPFDGNGNLKDKLDRLISISAKEFSDTLTAILPRYDSTANPAGWDSLNIFVNGTRQVKRLFKEYAYLKNRDYSSSTTRNAGLFSATSLWKFNDYIYACVPKEVYCMCQDTIHGSEAYVASRGDVHVMHMTGYDNPSSLPIDYNYFSPQPGNDNNWVVARTVTKWSPWGYELENQDAIGNFTAAMFGYNQQLPVALAQNARQHQVWAENFEDYQLLQVVSSLASMNFSPMLALLNLPTVSSNTLGAGYTYYNLTQGSGSWITGQAAHTGISSLATPSAGATLNLPVKVNAVAPGQPRYLPFTLETGKDYIVSYWFRPQSLGTDPVNNYAQAGGYTLKSNIIEGWQQVERRFTAGSAESIQLPKSAYVDDIRVMPADANMKAFVYHPVNQRLVATLDENNFASFYEYDQEGNLVRTKKETEKGILTVMESRSANVKK